MRSMSDRKMQMGSKGKSSVLPTETHTKKMSSPRGAGAITPDYPDTEEKIKKDQETAISKINSNKMKPGWRN